MVCRVTLLGYLGTFISKEGVTIRHFETETFYLGEGHELSFLVEGALSFEDDHFVETEYRSGPAIPS